MDRKDFSDRDSDAPGFTRHWQDSRSKGILLPHAVVASLEVEATARAAELKAVTASAITTATAKTIAPLPVLGGKDLPRIRIGTERDLADATAYAKELLENTVPPVLLSAQFSQDLLVAVLITTACQHPDHGMDDVLYYLVDPLWDCSRQIINHLQGTGLRLSPFAKVWFARFSIRTDALRNNDHALAAVLQAANRHWSAALTQPKMPECDRASPRSPSRTIQVFGPAALEQGAATV